MIFDCLCDVQGMLLQFGQRALSDEAVSEKIKVAVVHKNFQDAELPKLLSFAATFDSFACIKDEVINCSLAEAEARGNSAYAR